MNAAVKTSKSERHWGLDLGRILGFTCVMLTHQYSQDYGDWAWLAKFFDQAGRWAVPFFFTLSGFLYKDRGGVFKSAQHFGWRLLFPFFIWALFYNFFAQLTFYGGQVGYSSPFDFSQPLTYLRLAIHGGHGYHLWFLTSLFTCVMCVVIIRPMMNERQFVLFSLILFITGVLLHSYYIPLAGEIRFPFWNTRNGPFMGLIFFAAGMAFRNLETLARWKRRMPVILLAGITMQITELTGFYTLYNMPIDHHDVLFNRLPMGIGMFLLLHGLVIKNETLLGFIKKFSGCAMGANCFHVFFNDLLHDFITCQTLIHPGLATGLICAVLVALISFTCSYWGRKTPLIKKIMH